MNDSFITKSVLYYLSFDSRNSRRSLEAHKDYFYSVMELRRSEFWRERGVEMLYLVSFDPDVSCLTLIPLCSDTVSHVFLSTLGQFKQF